ncbi:hypothetical protein CCP2SC5_510021 [Azospirillaceae bacterium]
MESMTNRLSSPFMPPHPTAEPGQLQDFYTVGTDVPRYRRGFPSPNAMIYFRILRAINFFFVDTLADIPGSTEGTETLAI